MSAAEYTRIRNTPLSDLRRLDAWEVARFIESISPLQRQMIMRAFLA